MADSISGMMNFSDVADDAAKVRRDAVSADTTSNMVSSMVKATPPSMDYGGFTNQSPPPSVTMGGQSAIDNWKSQAQAVNKGMSNPFREGVGSAPPDFNSTGGKAPTPPKPTTTPASSPTASTSTPSYAPGAIKTDPLPTIDAKIASPRSPPLPDQGAQIENFKASLPSQNTGRSGDNDAMGSVLSNLKKVFDSFMPRSKNQKLTGGYT